jgi:hypothetical protein
LGANKEIKQYTGGNWTTICTLAGSAASVFQENSGVFDSQNKLYCMTSGYVVTPTFKYYSVVHKIDGAARSTVGDTLYCGAINSVRIKADAGDVPYLCFNAISATRVMAYKLEGNAWKFLADTTKNIGTMYSADITASGKVVFYTLEFTEARKTYFYENSALVKMDTFNTTGIVGAVHDLIIPAGSNDVYALVLEIKTGAVSDLSVMKHAVSGSGSSSVYKMSGTDKRFTVYPNPSNGEFYISRTAANGEGLQVGIYNLNGQLVHDQWLESSEQPIHTNLETGVYLVKTSGENGVSVQKIIINK